MLDYFMFFGAPFEIFDPTFVYPECLRQATALGRCPVWLTPFFSQPSVLPRPQLLSFDNHLDCLWLVLVFFTSAISLFSTLARSLPERATHLYCFQSVAHSLQKNAGVYPFAHVPSSLSRVAAAPVYNRVSITEAFS